MIISSFPAGDTFASVTDFNQPKVICPHCKRQSVMVSVFLKYNHINWYPMHTKGVTADIFCSSCRGLDNAETFPDYILAYADEQLKKKNKPRRLILTFAIVFWSAIGLFALSLFTTFF